MTRREIIENAITRAMDVVEKMKKSKRMTYTSHNVKVTKNLTLKIECEREDGTTGTDIGSAYGFAVYAVVKGTEIDGCSDWFSSIEDDIMYLLECYV